VEQELEKLQKNQVEVEETLAQKIKFLEKTQCELEETSK